MDNNKMVFKISPSILSADFARLGEEIKAIDDAGCDYVHIDVMDGHYVPNLTLGPQIIKSVRSWTNKIFDVHLMINPAQPFLKDYADAGADIITVHAEADPHIDRSLQCIRALGKKAGISLNPATPENIIKYLLDKLDYVLVMSVNPGFKGQDFLHSQVKKISRIKQMLGERPIDLAVDGGINLATIKSVVDAGANVIVAGSAIYKGSGVKDYRANIEALKAAAAVD